MHKEKDKGIMDEDCDRCGFKMRNALTALSMQLKEKEDTESEGLMQPEKEDGAKEAKDLLEAENKKSTSN